MHTIHIFTHTNIKIDRIYLNITTNNACRLKKFLKFIKQISFKNESKNDQSISNDMYSIILIQISIKYINSSFNWGSIYNLNSLCFHKFPAK